jgi:hypothetical protein
MLTLFHYLPYLLIGALGLLALFALLSDDGRKKRTAPERVRHSHYPWEDHHPRRG